MGSGLMSASPCWFELSDCPDSAGDTKGRRGQDQSVPRTPSKQLPLQPCKHLHSTLSSEGSSLGTPEERKKEVLWTPETPEPAPSRWRGVLGTVGRLAAVRASTHQIPVAPQCDSQHGLWTLPHVPGGRVGPGRVAAAEDQGEDDTHERSQRSPLCTAGMNPRVPPPPLGSSSQGSSPFLLSLH